MGVAFCEVSHHYKADKLLIYLHTVINIAVAGVGLYGVAASFWTLGLAPIAAPVLLRIGVVYLIYERAEGEAFVNKHFSKNGDAWNITPAMPPKGAVDY